MTDIKEADMHILISILFIIIGICSIIKPEIGWKVQHFMTVEGGEPTTFYLVFARIMGIVMVCVGVILLFTNW